MAIYRIYKRDSYSVEEICFINGKQKAIDFIIAQGSKGHMYTWRDASWGAKHKYLEDYQYKLEWVNDKLEKVFQPNGEKKFWKEFSTLNYALCTNEGNFYAEKIKIER